MNTNASFQLFVELRANYWMNYGILQPLQSMYPLNGAEVKFVDLDKRSDLNIYGTDVGEATLIQGAD